MTTVILLGILLLMQISMLDFWKSADKDMKFAAKILVWVGFGILAAIPLMEAHGLYSDAKKNMRNLSKGTVFICRGYDDNSYMVSKSGGWGTYDIYFIKDSLLIRADKCEEK
jgi:hypothetical protein